ncbi:MAG: 4Fe-4S binding protein [Deltaproteobacteria bacterium]|nr:4Fe-4S binding protein [Deltaproteobacteria bacterium]
MDFEAFAEGSLLWIVFVIFVIALVARLSFFAAAILRSAGNRQDRAGYSLLTFVRLFVPFHMGVPRRPVYAFLRYIFHLCLFAVPIWLGGHVILWAESRFEWDWISLPDPWSDWMSLILLALAFCFLIRRIFFKQVRKNSSLMDYLVILLTALPFLTGYFLTHGTLDGVGFLGEHIRLVHVLCGEAMLVMAAFLFCRTRMNPDLCTGCAACELACPTGTIESRDEGKYRIFHYSHYQCICCASCVNTCPEGAAELRHEISVPRFFQVLGKQEIQKAELRKCERCGVYFAPEPLTEKIARTLAQTEHYLSFCPNCRKVNIGETLRKLTPSPKIAPPVEKTSLFIQGRR